MTYYKTLDENGCACHGGQGQWSLPTDDGPGEWMPEIQDIQLCRRGYHLCRESDVVYWLAPTIYRAEMRGVSIEGDDKIVVSQARLLTRCDQWTDRTARLFAADCAERVLHLIPDDHKAVFVRAIGAARLFADGQCDESEMAATRAAAWAAAWAARAAAGAARDAAGAARAATRAAAGDAAGDAAWAWQTRHLMAIIEQDET